MSKVSFIVHQRLTLWRNRKKPIPESVQKTHPNENINVLKPVVNDFLFNPTITEADKIPADINPKSNNKINIDSAIPTPTHTSKNINPEIANKPILQICFINLRQT